MYNQCPTSGQSGRRVAAAAATATLLPQFFQDMSLYLVACTHTGSSEWKCDQQPGFWWGGQWIGPLWGVHWEPTCDALSPAWESNDGVLTSGRHWGSQKWENHVLKTFQWIGTSALPHSLAGVKTHRNLWLGRQRWETGVRWHMVSGLGGKQS